MHLQRAILVLGLTIHHQHLGVSARTRREAHASPGETSIMCANWQAVAAAVVYWVIMDHPGCGEASVGLHISTCTGAAIRVRQCHRPLARTSAEPAAGRRSPARRASSTPRAADRAWIHSWSAPGRARLPRAPCHAMSKRLSTGLARKGVAWAFNKRGHARSGCMSSLRL